MPWRSETLWSALVRRCVISLGAVMLFLQAPLTFAQSDDWRLEKTDQGIKVYSRAVADSPIRAVRGEVAINTDVDSAVNLLASVERRPSWDEMCVEAYLVASPAADVEQIYVHHDLPWPVKDRDMIMEVKWYRDDESGVATMHGRAITNGVPEYSDRVRVHKSVNSWVITPLAAGGISLAAEMHADPAGPIPAWLLNWLSVEAPITTLQKIKGILEKQVP
ncbi:MAG: hypothetical protein ACJA1I_002079 [Zhongshania marina]|jgi:hypothetical protein